MINFIKYKAVYFTLSGLLVGISLVSMVLWGFKPSVDFTGGSLLEISFSDQAFPNVSADGLQNEIKQVEGAEISSIQPRTQEKIFVIRLKEINEAKKNG